MPSAIAPNEPCAARRTSSSGWSGRIKGSLYILIVFAAGYDMTRLARMLSGPPITTSTTTVRYGAAAWDRLHPEL